jgi:TPR repeat protein
LGVEQDLDEARKWYWRAAEQNVSGVFVELGNMYERGLAVRADPEKAVVCYRRGRELGCPISACKLGEAYIRGDVLRREVWLARKCFAEAAAKGIPEAYHNLGRTYEQPELVMRFGETRARKLAIAFYRKAAAMGVPDSKEALRRLDVDED